MGKVRTGVRSFIEAFEGTPTRLQIITFDTKSATLGATSGNWNRFFDLAEPNDITALIGPTGTGGYVSTLTSDGGTNWEDALHRTFYSSNGQTYDQLGNPNAPTPELVVFFTDGVPTFDRIGGGSYTGSTVKSDTSSVGPPSIPSAIQLADRRRRRPLRQRLQPAAGGTGPTTSSTSSVTSA